MLAAITVDLETQQVTVTKDQVDVTVSRPNPPNVTISNPGGGIGPQGPPGPIGDAVTFGNGAPTGDPAAEGVAYIDLDDGAVYETQGPPEALTWVQTGRLPVPYVGDTPPDDPSVVLWVNTS